MRVILLSRTKEDYILQLEKKISGQIADFENMDSIDDLFKELTCPLNNIKVIIIDIVDNWEMHQLIKMQSKIERVNLIILLNEALYNNLQPFALLLNPSFICTPNRIDDVATVLMNIVKR